MAGGSATTVLWPDSAPVQVADGQSAWLFEGPTGGDLAGDEQFIDQALEAWQQGIAKSPNDTGKSVTGEPHVYWAGRVPAGEVAIVAQNGRHDEGIAVGILYGTPLRLLSEHPLYSGRGNGIAFQFGPNDEYVVALERGDSLFASPSWEEDTTHGGFTRQWYRMQAYDGVAYREFRPDDVVPAGMRVVRTENPSEAAGPDRSLTILPASRYNEGWDKQSKPVIDNRLPWPKDAVFRIDGAKTARGLDRDRLYNELLEFQMVDPLNLVWLSGFEVVAKLPNGNTLVAFESQPAVDRSRFYAAFVKPDGGIDQMMQGLALYPETTLPARLELPDRQGWIVAHYQAKLRYRTSGTGTWQDAGQNAALLPPDARQVEVTLPGKAPEVVNLKG